MSRSISIIKIKEIYQQERTMQMYEKTSERVNNVKDDPQARELLRRAYEKTSRWGKDFPGFTAELIVNDRGKRLQGSVIIKSPREVEVLVPDEGLQKWAQGQIAMMAIHRSTRPFEEADGKYTLTLADEDHHPFGRLLYIHGDGMNSSYRIKEDRITQINRSMERVKFTINVEESLTTQEGKHLTTRYTVFYFTPQDNRLAQAESYTDQPTVVAWPQPSQKLPLYLPGQRRVIYTENGETIVRILVFQGHKLLQ
jgi:hypothetical protein